VARSDPEAGTEMNGSSSQVAALRQTIAARAYDVDPQRVAAAIVWKFATVNRLRRSLSDLEGGRSRTARRSPRRRGT
jgi:hypothetical protein